MSIYKHILVYFWSGTGNSYRLAVNAAKSAEQRGVKSNLVSIDNSNIDESILKEPDSLIGIVFPVHGFTAPWHVIKFVFRLPGTNSTDAFCIISRGALKAGRIVIPGTAGTANFIIALMLMVKGYNVRGVMSADMPSNWYTLHPMQKRETHDYIVNRAVKKTEMFMGNILEGKSVWLTKNNLYDLSFGIVLSLISLGYLLAGRFFLAKLFFANSSCDGCGICDKVCSARAIKMYGKEIKRPYWTYSCESCMRCSAFCPKNAIESGHSWGVILYFITAVPLSSWLLSLAGKYFPGADHLSGAWNYIFNFICFYPALFISYFIFNLIVRYSIPNKLFSFSTFTHISSWGRYKEPGIKLKDLISKS